MSDQKAESIPKSYRFQISICLHSELYCVSTATNFRTRINLKFFQLISMQRNLYIGRDTVSRAIGLFPL